MVPARATDSVVNPILTEPSNEVIEVERPPTVTTSFRFKSNPERLYAETWEPLSQTMTTPSYKSNVVSIDETSVPTISETSALNPAPPDP